MENKLGYIENYSSFDFDKWFTKNKICCKLYNKYFNNKKSLYTAIIEDRFDLYADKIFNWITNFENDKVDFCKVNVQNALVNISTFNSVERSRNKIINNEALFNSRIYNNVEDDLEFWNNCYLHRIIHKNADYVRKYTDAVFYAELDLYFTLVKYFGYYNLYKEIFKGDDNA